MGSFYYDGRRDTARCGALAAAFATAATFATAAAPPAMASGFSVARFGSEHGHAASDHVTSIYFNPAGLARGDGTRIYAEGLFAYRTASYERPEEALDRVVEEDESATGTPREVVDANAGRAELSDVIASPFAGVASDFGTENFAAGAGVYVPFGGSASWSQNEAYRGSEAYPGAVDGVQRWHVIEGEQQYFYATAAGAYHIPRYDLTFGAGLNVVRGQVDTIRARTPSGTDDMVGASGEVFEGRSLIQVSGTELSLGAGAMWDPMEGLTIGLSYQSSPGFGETALSGTLTNVFGAGDEAPVDVVLEQSLPDIVRAGAAYRWPGFELRLAADYQRWSRFERQCLVRDTADSRCALAESGAVDEEAGGGGVIVNIPRDFRDTFGARAGLSYWFSPPTELFFSLGYDGSAIPDHTLEPTLIDMPKGAATAGLRYTLPDERLALSASLTHIAYADRSTEARPRDEEGEPEAPELPSRSPDGAGSYSQSLSVATLGLEGRF